MKNIETTQVNLSNQFALVFYGGSIGATKNFPVFIKGGVGSVITTGNDKETLKADAKRKTKQLSAGEKSYYKMGYSVIELTPKKVEQIKSLILTNSNKQ